MRDHRLGPLLITLVTWVALLLTLDGVGERPALPAGPGLTLDEIFNIDMGRYHSRALHDEGPLLWTPDGAQRVFQHPHYNPDHPPLGRLAIGVTHDFCRWVAPPSHSVTGPQATGISLYSARVAPATAFALTILLVGWMTLRWYGPFAGNIAALSLPLMPRLFGHAHFAALETFIGLAATLTVLVAAELLANHDHHANSRPLSWRRVCLVGFCLGLALLTKIQAILLPIPMGLWIIWQWRWRGFAAAVLFGLTGVAVFVIGWPWLWQDLTANLLTYLGRSTDRISLHCYYMGQQWNDRDVPWHYSLVMFLVSVPVILQVLGMIGAINACRRCLKQSMDPRLALVLGNILFPLIFFAIPGITVYDGVRLFLPVFPLWGVVIGVGALAVRDGLQSRWPHWFPNTTRATAVVVLFTLTQSYGVVATHPCSLSYYNAFVGGSRGATALGFEATYWRDSITRELLEDIAHTIPQGSTIYVAPVLHPANRQDLQLLSPILSSGDYQLDSYDDQDQQKQSAMQYVLVFRRHADPWASLEPSPAGAMQLAEVRRGNVQLAALYKLAAQ